MQVTRCVYFVLTFKTRKQYCEIVKLTRYLCPRVTCYGCRWNQLDMLIVILSVVGIVLEEMKTNVIPINPTIIRVMRVLRIARGGYNVDL